MTNSFFSSIIFQNYFLAIFADIFCLALEKGLFATFGHSIVLDSIVCFIIKMLYNC